MRAYETGLGEGSRIWVIAVVVAVIFALLGTPRAAWAHNALASTTPAAGSTVARPPAAVVLTFNEPAIATGTMVLVTGPNGSATQGEPRLIDNSVTQDLQLALPAGTYTVNWRVTSADGHPVNGTFTFRARAGARVQTDSTGPSTSPTSAATPSTSAASSGAATAGPVSDDTGTGGSRWWWLLAILPIGLAAVLGWRFSRRGGG